MSSANMSLQIAILTISDRSARGERRDVSGTVLADWARAQGWEVARQAIVADEPAAISARLIDWADSALVDVILTTGGTGFAPRDVTPEATRAVLDRLAPGLAEAMRSASLRVTPHAMLSRGTAGIRGRCLIVNLPGNPNGALENAQVILPVIPHAVQLLHEDPRAEAGHQPDM
jgi:molybdopterin adenylyltransferase